MTVSFLQRTRKTDIKARRYFVEATPSVHGGNVLTEKPDWSGPFSSPFCPKFIHGLINVVPKKSNCSADSIDISSKKCRKKRKQVRTAAEGITACLPQSKNAGLGKGASGSL